MESTIGRLTPFILGVVVISTLHVAMPRSEVHRFMIHDLHMVVEGEAYLHPRIRWIYLMHLERGDSAHTLHIGCGGHFQCVAANAALRRISSCFFHDVEKVLSAAGYR